MPEILRSQEKLYLKIDSVFGDDIVLRSLTGHEQMLELFEFHLTITSPNPSLDFDKILLSEATVSIDTNQTKRYINGIISNFSQGETHKTDEIEITVYNATLVPKLWLLTLEQNCAIFQNKNNIEIIKEIISKHKIIFSDNTKKCGKTNREYCMQYNESDFHFISRLMRDEGITFFFEHKNKEHKLILTDETSVYIRDENAKELNYTSAAIDGIPPFNSLLSCNYGENAFTKSFATSDYNFQTPSTDLYQKADGKGKIGTVYDYPGIFEKTDQGEHIVNVRLQQLQASHKTLRCRSTCPYLGAGYVLGLKKHPSKKLDTDYVVIKIDHYLETRVSKESKNFYYNVFYAIPASMAFVPAKAQMQNKIPSMFRGKVVGPQGQEIYCDKYRRIKVQLYFDRVNKKDENSSCWMRVIQPIAGKNWGTTFTPRIGTEVIVSTLDGNMNNLAVIGCLYNAENMPPYSDTDATKTTIKTVSSKGSDGFNEVCFEDKKGEEKIDIHAEKDMSLVIKNSRTATIEESNDSITLNKGSFFTHLKGEGDANADYNLTLSKGSFNLVLDKGDALTTIQYGNSKLNISDNYNQVIGGELTISVKGNINIKSDGELNIEGQKIQIKALESISINSGTELNIKSGTDFAVSAGLGAKVSADTSLELSGMVSTSVKGASIEINAEGQARFQSPMITLGGGMVTIG